MPNHTTNILTLTGDAVEIEKVRDKLRTTDCKGQLTNLSFGTIRPMPKELIGTVSGSESAKPDWQKQKRQELIEKYDAADWHTWCCENWGTKWDAYDIGEWEDDVIKFYTAWSPPVPVIDHLSAMFPKVNINLRSADEGCGFVCSMDWTEGNMINDETYTEAGAAFYSLMYDITGRDIEEEERQYKEDYPDES